MINKTAAWRTAKSQPRPPCNRCVPPPRIQRQKKPCSMRQAVNSSHTVLKTRTVTQQIAVTVIGGAALAL